MLFVLITTLLAFFITPAVIALYKHYGWIEAPEKKKHVKVTHQYPIPRGGGLIIFLSILIGSLLFLHFDKYLISILVGAAILTVVGLFDDIWDIHPIFRLVSGLVVALIVVGSGIGIAYVTNPFGAGVIHLDTLKYSFEFMGSTHTLWIFSNILAVFFILWNMNIVNWSKGLDGQMPGFVGIALIFIGILSQRFIDDPTQFNTQALALLVAGAFFGFLIWNMYPQKIMAGYGAGSLAGYFLAVLSILSGAKIATTLMVLAIPTADAVFTIARRIRAGKSPLWGDRGHLHHKLMDAFGWGRRRIALFYWGTTFVMGVLSLYLNTFGKVVTMVIASSLVFGLLIWAKFKMVQSEKKRKSYS
jgi:UDP-GlcNAc:undecaprenyl-phosphate/decaprenyl-phosphate GlcNAc-1-phosphate transferase